MKQLRRITEKNLGQLALAINAEHVCKEDIQIIAQEGGKWTALVWLETYNGAFHSVYTDADGNKREEHISFKDFYQGNLPTGPRKTALEAAIMHWQDERLNEEAENAATNNGWNELAEDGSGAIVGRYWVTLDD